MLTAFFSVALSIVAVQDESQLKQIHVKPQETVGEIDFPTLLQVDADPQEGFQFPYFLFLPELKDSTQPMYMLVEPNNTGSAVDDFKVHLNSARRLATRSYPHHLAKELGTPLLVPVFPRPRSDWRIYTHALDRDSMLVEEGKLKRIDLQLIAMIDHARELLAGADLETKPRVFMHGFSASGTFANRFAALHPSRVRAVASGGVNGLPILPVAQHADETLPFPIGISNLETLTGTKFDESAYGNVAQFIYMGYLDRNDTYPYGDAWNDEERELISKAVGQQMMPERWDTCQAVFSELEFPIQLVTYNGCGHEIKREMLQDIVAFFQANSGDQPALIEAHEYPFVPFREITTGHIDGLLWSGDERLPSSHRALNPDSAFVIRISDWIEGQSYQQLSTFFQNAVFEFAVYEGDQQVLTIDRGNFAGTRSSGDGRFQAFEIRLNKEQLDLLKSSTEYTLKPINQDEKYQWVVEPAVKLKRPEEDKPEKDKRP